TLYSYQFDFPTILISRLCLSKKLPNISCERKIFISCTLNFVHMLYRMRRSILTLCIGVAAIAPAKAQSPLYVEPPGWSLGVNFGLTDLWGDVGTKTIV